jgi:hypothetical protein
VKNPFPWKAQPPLTVVPKESRTRSRRNPGLDATILQRRNTRVPSGPVDRTIEDGHAPLPAPTVRARPASASHDLLIYLGHNESCAALRRRGMIASCDCPIKPIEDPAITIGLVIHFARMSLAQHCAIPPVLIELLARRVEEGDAACIMIAKWLDAIGLAELKPMPRRSRGSR